VNIPLGRTFLIGTATALLTLACGESREATSDDDNTSGACKVAKGNTEGDPSACLRSTGIRWATDENPSNEVADLLRGPKSNPQFGLDSEVHCFFRPHARSQNSPKFRCFRTNESGVFFNDDGELEPRAKNVGPEEGDNEDALLDASGNPLKNAAGKNIKGDELKIKYFRGGTQQGSHFEGADLITRDRESEMFTETASARLFWALGLPADRMFEVSRVHCTGCGEDPFTQTRFLPGQSATFHTPAVERKFSGKKIAETFSFDEAVRVRGSFPSQVQPEFESLILAMQLIHYHNTADQQNRVVCRKGGVDEATGACSQPTFLIQDLGSTWGGSGGLFQQNPRGDFRKYSEGNAVRSPGSCELALSVGGLRTVSQAGLDDFARRIRPLTREKLRAIFVAARFDRVEPDRLASLGAQTVIDQWTDALVKRVNALRTCARLAPIP
jgi:hypothetical protein